MGKMHRKLIRDLKTSKGLFLAVTIIILLAVSFFGAMSMAYRNLGSSYDYSYEKLRFADFTVKVARDATGALDQLGEISGIDAVTGRVNADFALTLPGAEAKKVLARVISLPSSDAARAEMVNDVLVEEGDYFPNGTDNFLLVEKNFAEHHGLQPGQSVSLTLGEDEIPFEIAGIAASPEYIFPAKSRQEVLVSAEVFGVVFVPDTVGTGLLEQPITELCFIVADQADRDMLMSQVESALSPYQVMDIVPREDQPSYASLEMDLEQFATLAEIFPLLFIIVGAMAIYILLTRIIYNQRTQIGLMRAVGYSRRQVMVHYLGFALVIGIVGSVAGTVSGYLLSEALTNFYASLINLPFTITQPQWLAMGEGFMLGLLPCVIAGLIPAWSASRILPAEAMRTPAPAAGRKLLLERLFPFLTRLSSLWKIPLRNIFRNRRRSLYTAIGVMFGVSLILISAAMIDSIEALIDFQFNDVQRYDARIDFASPQPSTLVDEIEGWDEVEAVEPMLAIPTRLEHMGEAYSTLTVALTPGSELRGLYSLSGDPVSVSDEGILLSEALRSTLDIRAGDMLNVQSPWGAARLEVMGFVKEPMGSFGYVTLERAQSIAGGMEVISGLLVRVAPGQADAIREKAYEIGATASVELTHETKAEMDDMMEGGMAMLWIMLLFGAALALAIVFTTVTVNILERRREIATMRTLGEGKGRINAMITIENLLLGLGGLLPGIVLGYAIALYFFSLFQGDMFAFDLVIFPRTYFLTVGIVILIVLVSQIPSIRSLGRLNLASVTKEQAS